MREEDKKHMNAKGVFVAPGQSVGTDGAVRGDVPEGEAASFWVSGLCSPFRTFSQRAAEYQDAQQSGDMYRVQTVVNASVSVSCGHQRRLMHCHSKR